MTESEIKLKCLETAAQARARTGLYAPDDAMADARRFYGWVTEGAPKDQESPEAKPQKQSKTG